MRRNGCLIAIGVVIAAFIIGVALTPSEDSPPRPQPTVTVTETVKSPQPETPGDVDLPNIDAPHIHKPCRDRHRWLPC